MGDNRGPVAPEFPAHSGQIVDIAREVVRQLEPEELVVFDAVAESWRSGTLAARRRRREPGSAIGFGVDAVLFSQLIFPIIAAALGQVLGTSLTDRMHSGRDSATRPAAGDGRGAVAGHNIALTVDELRAIHEICQRDAATVGLAPSKARLLADAVVGALSATPGRAGQ
jgi:hypothetical protein